jgi:hypothetical protein
LPVEDERVFWTVVGWDNVGDELFGENEPVPGGNPQVVPVEKTIAKLEILDNICRNLVAIQVVFEGGGNGDIVHDSASEESFELWNAVFDEIVCDAEDKSAVPRIPFKNPLPVGIANKVGVSEELPLIKETEVVIR